MSFYIILFGLCYALQGYLVTLTAIINMAALAVVACKWAFHPPGPHDCCHAELVKNIAIYLLFDPHNAQKLSLENEMCYQIYDICLWAPLYARIGNTI